jgi:phage-related protein
MWEIEFYKTKDDKEVVAEFLDSLPRKHKAKAFWEIDLLAEQGTALREPYAKHLEDEIWYLRVKFSSDISRVFYFIATDTKIVLLHGFVKKTDEIPPAESNIAKKRLADYKERYLK